MLNSEAGRACARVGSLFPAQSYAGARGVIPDSGGRSYRETPLKFLHIFRFFRHVDGEELVILGTALTGH